MAGFLLLTLIYIHLLIHLMGFSKAFGYSNISFAGRNITRSEGIAWLVTALLFLAVSLGIVMQQTWWPVAGIAAVVFSQVMITRRWKEARAGTVINCIILVICIIELYK